MTMTEKIFSRASEKTQLSPGDNVWVNVDILMTHDVCGPGAMGIFKREFGENAKVSTILISSFFMNMSSVLYLYSMKQLIFTLLCREMVCH